MARLVLRGSALVLLLVLASCGSPSLKRSTLSPRVAKLAATGHAVIRGERLLEPGALVEFYRARRAEPAWTLPGDALSIRAALLDLAPDGLVPADYHLALLDRLLAARKQKATQALDADLELVLSDAVAAAVDHVRYGRVAPQTLNPAWNVDPRAGAPPLALALADVARAATPAEGIAQQKPTHFIYQGLKGELARLRAAQQAGGWHPIALGKPIAPGARDRRVPAVRARLAATGELAQASVPARVATVYDRALVAAVQQFQDRHRIPASGRIDAATLDALDVPADARIAQVSANLERARWVLPGLAGDFVLVNLPAFKVYLIRGGRNVWECRTAIGKDATQTPTFRSNLRTVVFNPTWTVPQTIVTNEILGGDDNAQDAVARKHMRVLDAQGNEVDPSTVDWSASTPDDFPYTLRQDAGEDNALGRVKFLFPNPYDVYLHDTPSRGGFAAAQRAFSHGCIRVEDPLGLAAQLLGDQGWDAARIQQAIDSGQTQGVDLARPLPILIVYWTVSVGATGEVRYAPDVYAMDPPLERALAAPPAPRPMRVARARVRR